MPFSKLAFFWLLLKWLMDYMVYYGAHIAYGLPMLYNNEINVSVLTAWLDALVLDINYSILLSALERGYY